MERTLGQLLKDAMDRRSITGVDLAERIGRSPSFVSELINDEKKVPPPPATLAAIERELGVSQRVMLSAWGYEVHPTTEPSTFTPEREAVLYVLDQMEPDLAQAYAEAGELLLRIRRTQTLANRQEERVPALR